MRIRCAITRAGVPEVHTARSRRYSMYEAQRIAISRAYRPRMYACARGATARAESCTHLSYTACELGDVSLALLYEVQLYTMTRSVNTQQLNTEHITEDRTLETRLIHGAADVRGLLYYPLFTVSQHLQSTTTTSAAR